MIYLLVGVPCSGKSWVADQVREKVLYLEHDAYIGSKFHVEDYLEDILELAPISAKPLLIETPFSVSSYIGPLIQAELPYKLLYICEDRYTLADRYMEREDKDIPKGHLSRNRTYIERALATGDFVGTSEEVLKELKRLLG